MRTREVSTIYEYLESVTVLLEIGEKLWFRGIASIDYNLVPGLVWRNESQWESNFVHQFLVAYKGYTNLRCDNPWELYGLMQNHGLPTRLLDWTKSPLYGLYFALTQEPDKNTDRVVWVLPPYTLNKLTMGVASIFCPGGLKSRSIKLEDGSELNLDSYLPEALDPNDNHCIPEKPMAIESPLSYPRIKGQLGCFTVHGSSSNSIDHYFSDIEEPPYIFSIVLKTKDNRNTFLDPLLSWGINEEYIYQDLDSMVERICREQGLF